MFLWSEMALNFCFHGHVILFEKSRKSGWDYHCQQNGVGRGKDSDRREKWKKRTSGVGTLRRGKDYRGHWGSQVTWLTTQQRFGSSTGSETEDVGWFNQT